MAEKTAEDKEKDIKNCLELFDKNKVKYQIGNTQDGRYFCGHNGDSLFEPELVTTDVDRNSYNSWYGRDRYEAIMKASMAYWAMQYMLGNEEL